MYTLNFVEVSVSFSGCSCKDIRSCRLLLESCKSSSATPNGHDLLSLNKSQRTQQLSNLRDIECFLFLRHPVLFLDLLLFRLNERMTCDSLCVSACGAPGGQRDGKKPDNKETGKHLLHSLQLMTGACPCLHRPCNGASGRTCTRWRVVRLHW